jgi:hypothetical protein
MLGTLVFEFPVDRLHAERCLLAFAAGFRDLLGEMPDAAGLQVDLTDGIHCHLLWAGRSLTREEQSGVAALWPHGLVLLSHVRDNPVLREADLASWDRMIEGGGQWQSLVSR